MSANIRQVFSIFLVFSSLFLRGFFILIKNLDVFVCVVCEMVEEISEQTLVIFLQTIVLFLIFEEQVVVCRFTNGG